MSRSSRAGSLRAVVGRVRRVPRGRLTAGAAAVVLVVSVPFGGLKQSYAETHPAQPAEVDQLLHADPFSITVTGASFMDALRSYRADGTSVRLVAPEDAAHNLLLVKATVVNTSDASVSASMIGVAAMPADHRPNKANVLFAELSAGHELEGDLGAYSVDDATSVSTLSPGVPYHLALIAEFSGPFPRSVKLGVARLSYDPEAISEEVLSWQHPEPAYQLTVPVIDKRGAKQRPDGWVPVDGDEG